MKRLPVRPQPQPYEQLRGYLHRLASANGYWSPRELWFSLAEPGAAHDQVLAHAIGISKLPVFSAPAPNWLKLPVSSHGLAADQFNRYHQRHCPDCITESEWSRPYWGLNLATTCTRHRCWLGDSGEHFPKAAAPPDTTVLALGEMLEHAFEHQASAPHPALPMFGQALSLMQILRLIRYLGGVAGPAHTDKPGQLAQAFKLDVARQRVQAAASLLADWPNSFWGHLDQLMAEAPPTFSVRKVFGRLYRVLYVDLPDAEYQGLRDGFELYLREHWRGELCGRHRGFVAEGWEEQSRISFTRAHRALGIQPGVLRSLLESKPADVERHRAGKRTFTTFDYETLRELAANPIRYLDLQTTAQLLGIGEIRLRELVAGGVIVADVTAAASADHRWKFRQSVVEGFLERFQRDGNAELHAALPVSLGHMLSYWRLSPRECCALIQVIGDGGVPCQVAQPLKFSELVVDEELIRSWLDDWRSRQHQWLSIPETAKALRLKEQVIYELVAKGLIVADLTIRKGHYFRGVTEENLCRFRREYVALSELAKQHCTSAVHLLRKLLVEPVTGPKIDGGRQYFYRCVDVEAAGRLAPARSADQ